MAIVRKQFRLVPVTIAALLLLLGLKGASLWQDGVAMVVATAEAQGAKSAEPAKTAPPPENATAAAAAAKRDPGDLTKGEMEVLASLSARREALDARIRDLDMRENLLTATERQVDEKIGELKKLEARIQGMIKQHDETEERNLRSLVKVYENMKPKEAARIFERLEMTVLLGVVERMREAKLAPVLAEMDAGRAQKVTVELATRRQLPGGGKPADRKG